MKGWGAGLATTSKAKKVATTATTVNFMIVRFFLVTWDEKVSPNHEERRGSCPTSYGIESRLSSLCAFKDALTSGFIDFLPANLKDLLIQINPSCKKKEIVGPRVFRVTGSSP